MTAILTYKSFEGNMYKQKREPQQTDQKIAADAYIMLKDLIISKPQIEPTLWAGALVTMLIDGFKNSGYSYEDFCNEFENIKIHFKYVWDDEK